MVGSQTRAERGNGEIYYLKAALFKYFQRLYGEILLCRYCIEKIVKILTKCRLHFLSKERIIITVS